MALKKRSLFADYNISAPGANTGITGGFTVGSNTSAIRITIAATTSSVVNLTATDGTTAHKWGLDESNAVQAADLYTFPVINGQLGLTYDVEVETDGVIEVLNIVELIEE